MFISAKLSFFSFIEKLESVVHSSNYFARSVFSMGIPFQYHDIKKHGTD